MKRTLIALFAVMSVAAFALASSLPQSGTVVVTNDSGAQVGSGSISNGTFNLTLDSGTSGLVTITVTAANGETETYQAMIDANGQVTVVHDSSFEDLGSFAKNSGIDKVEVSESTEQQGSGSDASSNDSSSNDGTAAEDSSGDSSSSSQEDSNDSSSTESSGDSIHVGTSVGSGSTSTDTSVDVSGSNDD